MVKNVEVVGVSPTASFMRKLAQVSEVTSHLKTEHSQAVSVALQRVARYGEEQTKRAREMLK